MRKRRINNYKLVFAEQRAHGFEVWENPFTFLRLPELFNLRSDPFEEVDEIGSGYIHWRADHLFVLVPAQDIVGQFLVTFREFPPRQTPASFSIDQVMEKLKPPTNQAGNSTRSEKDEVGGGRCGQGGHRGRKHDTLISKQRPNISRQLRATARQPNPTAVLRQPIATAWARRRPSERGD